MHTAAAKLEDSTMERRQGSSVHFGDRTFSVGGHYIVAAAENDDDGLSCSLSLVDAHRTERGKGCGEHES